MFEMEGCQSFWLVENMLHMICFYMADIFQQIDLKHFFFFNWAHITKHNPILISDCSVNRNLKQWRDGGLWPRGTGCTPLPRGGSPGWVSCWDGHSSPNKPPWRAQNKISGNDAFVYFLWIHFDMFEQSLFYLWFFNIFTFQTVKYTLHWDTEASKLKSVSPNGTMSR